LAEIPEEQLGSVAQLGSPLSGVLDVYLHRGELGPAREMLARYEQIGRSSELQMQAGYEAATAAVMLSEGNPRGALPVAEKAFAFREKLGIAFQDVKRAFCHALEAALALGDRGKAEELLAAVDELPPGLRPPLLDAMVHRFRAFLSGDDADAEGEFGAAQVALRELALPFHLAVVQLEHGEWLLARGRGDDAETLLAEARETFERLQATPWLERLDAVAAGSPAEVPA
jgi:hypothetical protein